MRAKIKRTIPKLLGFKPNETYEVVKVSDSKEGVYLKDEYGNSVFVKNTFVELLENDGITQFKSDKFNVSFGGQVPIEVDYDPLTKILRVTYS
jgi:hypothetical protein